MRKIFPSVFIVTLVVGALYTLQPAYAASAGDLVRCPDFSSVYFLAHDGKRYVFPNEQIYKSWYSDFDAVKTISCANLGLLPLGDRVMYQPGTSLVKIPSDPSVFVIEDNDIVREIPDEATAVALFGNDWSSRVDDVSEAFWSSFTQGEPLASKEVPEGTILEDHLNKLFRVRDDGTAIEVDSLLTADQEIVLREHALHIDDIELRMGVDITLTPVDTTTAATVLTDIAHTLETVHINNEEEKEMADIPEVESIDTPDATSSADGSIDANASEDTHTIDNSSNSSGPNTHGTSNSSDGSDGSGD